MSISSSDANQSPRLLDELRETRRDLVKTCGPAAVVSLIGFLIAFYFVEPPPPREVTIAAGPAHGNYFSAAMRYAALFKKNRITLNVRETAGSVENYELLRNDDSVQLAIVQGGTLPDDEDKTSLESIASLYVEPMWIFHRRSDSYKSLADLRGHVIAVDEEGSGTRALAKKLLAANGVIDGRNDTKFVNVKLVNASEKLRNGEIHAAFFVLSAKSPIIHEMLQDDRLDLFSFDRSHAYTQRYPFLQEVVLARGVIDLERDLPRTDVKLIAPAANLVATRELHDAFIPLLLEAALDVHATNVTTAESSELPSLDAVEFPPNPVARHYLNHGPSAFQSWVGFWMASLIDRAKILIVPFIVLLIPLFKLAPPVYRWRIRSRIYRWYGLLRQIDRAFQTDDRESLRKFRRKVRSVEQELADVSVPLSYMEEFYHLRLHIDLVKRRLEEQLSATGSETTTSERTIEESAAETP